MPITRPFLLAACAALITLHAHAATPQQWKSDYDTLQKWQYASSGIPLAKPITITRDTATWTLNSGTVHLGQPTPSGRVTALVFEGDGYFTMTIPDRFELAQLRRFAEKPALQKFDEPITQLVLRVSDDTIDKLFPNAPTSGFAANAIAEKRQNHWLIDLGDDVDAGVIAAMANPGAAKFTAGFKTLAFDWLTYDYDSSRAEEIRVSRYQRGAAEIWLSLDRAEDRTQDGRPGANDERQATLDHIDVKADLTKYSLTGTSGETDQRLIKAHFTVGEVFTPKIAGVSALVVQLHPAAQKLNAKDEHGNELVVLRDHIGARTMNIDNKYYNSAVTVLLPAPLTLVEPLRITFDYDLEMPNYALGNIWYPTIPDAFDTHTAKLQLVVNKRNEVRAMGKLDDTKEDDKTKTTTWIVDKPAKMITFSTAERFEEVALDVKGIPQVVSFGWSRGLNVGARVRNSGADVANSLQFFQQLLDSPIGSDGKFYVTSITGYHGQAFDGFLHLAESTYSEHPGASELFRAHEVAHEWFGHRVGWRSYRDQWLSEAMAEYASMIFVKTVVKNGENFFNEILQSYDGIVKGNMSGGFSKFNRPWLIERNSVTRARLAPIGHGYRASTGDFPAGYEIQTYIKGPLVLHMLRETLLAKTHSDDTFVKILRDYVKEYSGKQASTADFQKIVERDAPGDWSWFFNQWIYGAEIPTIRWSYRVEPDGSKYKLTITTKRSDVSPDFMIVAPLRLEFDGGKVGTTFVVIRNDEQTTTQMLPAQPRNVVFAPNHSLLANIRKE